MSKWALARGLDVDDFAPRLSFLQSPKSTFFEEIARYAPRAGSGRESCARPSGAKSSARPTKVWTVGGGYEPAGQRLPRAEAPGDGRLQAGASPECGCGAIALRWDISLREISWPMRRHHESCHISHESILSFNLSSCGRRIAASLLPRRKPKTRAPSRTQAPAPQGLIKQRRSIPNARRGREARDAGYLGRKNDFMMFAEAAGVVVLHERQTPLRHSSATVDSKSCLPRKHRRQLGKLPKAIRQNSSARQTEMSAPSPHRLHQTSASKLSSAIFPIVPWQKQGGVEGRTHGRFCDDRCPAKK